MNPTLDLWPSNLEAVKVVPPAAILRQQAALLAQKTQGLVTASVQPSSRTVRVEAFPLLGQQPPPPAPDAVEHDFYLTSPALGDYRYRLLSIRHGAVALYPVEIHSGASGAPLVAASEDQFVEMLRTVFNSEETKRVVGSLLAQSKS